MHFCFVYIICVLQEESRLTFKEVAYHSTETTGPISICSIDRLKHYSTESALLNIHNDILLNMAKGSVTTLTLLDLSAAFDTIDHTILLDILNVYYGISELALLRQ